MAHTTLKDNVIAAGPSNLSRHGRGYMPASTILFGRDPDVIFIVNQLTWQPETPETKRARFAILGTGGMGKTSVALKVVRDARLLECYPQHYQAWFPCVQATSFPLLLDTVHSALDLPSDTKNTLNAILNELQSSTKPMILLFDNFETPWNASGARAEVAQFLRDIDAIPHVAIFLTMRAAIPLCEEIKWTEMRIQPLDQHASYQLYTEIDTKAQNDEKLSELLKMLGHMPLAVKLMARQGRSTGCTVEQLMKSYQTTGTAMLGPSRDSDAQNSVSISISLSLDSLPIQREPNAYELVCRISMLPAGTTFQALQLLWAPHISNLQSPLQALLDTSLLEYSTRTYFVLPVIRSHVLDPQHLPTSVQNSMVEAACRFLQTHNATEPGKPSYKEDMEARSIEEINLQSILLDTTSSEPHLIQALLTLAWHQLKIRPRTEVIQHAAKLMNNVTGQKLIGDIFNCHAGILRELNHWKESLDQFNLARRTYLDASEPRLAALALLDIAYVSPYINSNTNEISLIEQAKLELETLQSPKHNQQHFLPSLSTLRNRFKKGTGQPKDISILDNEDLASCLIQLAWHVHVGDIISKPLNTSHVPVNCVQRHLIIGHDVHKILRAEKWGLLALKEWQEMGDSDVSYVLRILGRIYISKGQYDQAVKYLTEGLDRAKARTDGWEVADILLQLGRAKMKKGETDDAQIFFTEALVHFGPLQGVERRMIVCRFYLTKVEDPSWLPTEEECHALRRTRHDEDIPL
ncbi:hypothetical protein C8J56DRAFT_1139925 [Mycena floridula]|nr:hypothetical protein C8J56DRAFT_1139925 [Mycena floridula]